jgi:hypothetical protein
LRVDANDLGLTKDCLKLLDTIEDDAGIGNRMCKKTAWQATHFRRRFTSDDEYADEDGHA